MGVSKESYLLKVKSSKGWSSSKTLSKDEDGSSGVRSKELAYQGGSFDHSVRSKARLHQALEQRRYAPKNKEKFLIEGLMFRVFRWSHDFRLRNGDPMHAPIWVWVSRLHPPIVFFFEFRLFSIVSTFGIGLTLEGPTKLVSRPPLTIKLGFV